MVGKDLLALEGRWSTLTAEAYVSASNAEPTAGCSFPSPAEFESYLNLRSCELGKLELDELMFLVVDIQSVDVDLHL